MLSPGRWGRWTVASVRFAFSLAVLAALTGCAGLQLRLLDSSVTAPGRVELFFRVQDGQSPVSGLDESDFVIFEGGAPISQYESGQTILPRRLSYRSHALLLVDMSGSIVESGALPDVVNALEAFIGESVSEDGSQAIAIYAFDGGPKLHEVVPFTRDERSLFAGLDRLRAFEVRDPSTNLNGAILRGLRFVQGESQSAQVPFSAAALVVFTDGRDRAGRVVQAELMRGVREARSRDVSIFAIGLGGEIDQAALARIGRDGFEYASDSDAISDAFITIAERIRRKTLGHYSLAYCTPARAGRVRLALEARHKERTGRLRWAFSADGFGPGCDPSAESPQGDQLSRSRSQSGRRSGLFLNVGARRVSPLRVAIGIGGLTKLGTSSWYIADGDPGFPSAVSDFNWARKPHSARLLFCADTQLSLLRLRGCVGGAPHSGRTSIRVGNEYHVLTGTDGDGFASGELGIGLPLDNSGGGPLVQLTPYAMARLGMFRSRVRRSWQYAGYPPEDENAAYQLRAVPTFGASLGLDFVLHPAVSLTLDGWYSVGIGAGGLEEAGGLFSFGLSLPPDDR